MLQPHKKNIILRYLSLFSILITRLNLDSATFIKHDGTSIKIFYIKIIVIKNFNSISQVSLIIGFNLIFIDQNTLENIMLQRKKFKIYLNIFIFFHKRKNSKNFLKILFYND